MKISRLELKKKLKEIKANECKVSADMDAFEMSVAMLENLGDIDGELRDDLIYFILSRWMSKGILSKEQLKQLLQISIDDKHLFFKIGDQNKDSVFMRTFSVLIIAVIIYCHRQDSFLTKEELMNVKDRMIQYMSEEKDVRGYVEERGWAHSTAHAADVLDELALCEELEARDLMEILEAIQNKVCIDYHAYICYEDERLAYATNSLISRNLLSEQELSVWVRCFAERNMIMEVPRHFYLVSNMRNYLNSLYHRLPAGEYPLIKASISETVLKIRRF